MAKLPRKSKPLSAAKRKPERTTSRQRENAALAALAANNRKRRDAAPVPAPEPEAPRPKKGISKIAGKPTAAKRDETIFAAWKDGTSIKDLVAEHGLSRSECRKILTAGAGGKDAFRQLRAQGAGGKVEPFGGKRATPRTREVVQQDDAQTPRIHHAFVEAGWTHRLERRGDIPHMVFTNPDGVEFVQAGMSEKADLIFESTKHGSLPAYRLRRLDASGKAKRVAKQEQEQARGEAALERTRARKRAAKKGRTRKPKSHKTRKGN